MRTHVDLFSGIGGFAIAAQANGVRTIQFVEIDRRCRAFLSKAWPGIPIHDDIRTFRWNGGMANTGLQRSGKDFEIGGSQGRDVDRRNSPVWLLTGGVPCQPASRAGRQRGAADDRWLWPEAIRCLAAIRPTWALLENPPGIGDVGLAGILAQVEAEGYEVSVVSVGACAVGAPHRRMRYWIVAHSTRNTEGRIRETPGAMRERTRASDAGRMADSEAGIERPGLREAEQGRQWWGRSGDGDSGFWDSACWLPCADGKVRRAPPDSFGLVDGLHRSILASLGNSIVWQVAAEIIAAMIESEQ